LLGRSLAIGLTANFHIVFAAFLLGGPIVAVFLEWFGLRRREDFYDHLARGLTKVMVICFSIGATFGVTLVVLLTGLFPRFWAGWLNVFFWPLLLEALMFFLEAASLYAYYYTWDRFAQRRRLHMSFGLLNVVSGTATMVIINAVAAAMLTPPADLAQRPWAWATMYLSNPTWFPLTLHRFVANVSLTGFLLAMWAGYAFLKAKNPEQRAFRDLAGHAGILLGLAGLFLLPPIGILYVLEIRRASPPGFVNLMLGPTRYIFNIQIILLTALFVLSNWYLLFRTAANHPSRTLHRLLLVVSILSAILAILPYNIGGGRHIVLGKMHFKYLGLAVLGLITIYSLATQRKNARTLPWGAASRAPQVGLVALGLVAFAIMNVMGFARETARHPYLVFNQMPLKEETNLGEQAVAGPGDELGASCPFLPAKAPPQQPKAETPQETGARLYADNGCSGCHVLQGNGGTVGPALDAVGSRHDVDWMIAHFKDPQALVPGSAMPKYDLPEDQLRALSEYLATFK
jgi:cytochrome bd-type quinol oxidase subunit 1/cytochrome c2